ncbi:MAG: Smr/MutS family protein [Pseudomonadota bacterium]
MPRKPRDLTADEQALWDKVIRQVARVEKDASIPAPVNTPNKPDPVTEVRPSRIGGQSKSKPTEAPKPSFVDRPSQTSPNMDRRNFQRLLKGRLDIDGTLDLHGMTADQAQQRLGLFVRNAHSTGQRLLLIITGKGQRADTDEFGRPRRGVLKAGVPEWLKSGTLSDLILQVTQAHPKHGGGGAYYVYLRRRRK